MPSLPKEMLRPLIPIVGFTAVLAGCDTGEPRSEYLDGPEPVLELRLARDQPAEGYVEMAAPDGERLYVQETAVVSDRDILYAHAEPISEGVLLTVRLNVEARERLSQRTAEHIGRPLAVLSGSRVVYTGRVASALGAPTSSIGMVLTDEERRILMKRIAERWPVEDPDRIEPGQSDPEP